MKNEFNIGDKVKCINADDQYDDLVKDEIYTVVQTYGANYLQVVGKFRGDDDGSKYHWRLSSHFELVSKKIKSSNKIQKDRSALRQIKEIAEKHGLVETIRIKKRFGRWRSITYKVQVVVLERDGMS